ncbi:hypothetical protein [Klebsiella sp. WP4-W18-ESBL-05]|uniref:hypothetical protein n=1 Tax=Klebsiella sp. WP4-W18-ESBL-05 TaxID=2675713 RepID=UPI001D0F9DDA|nr:hypothetical protein [Klebsiella sp. WP4-W18-ESBL-05]
MQNLLRLSYEKILLLASVNLRDDYQGIELNAQERLLIRTRVATSLAARDRHRQRMSAPVFQWKKPDSPPR